MPAFAENGGGGGGQGCQVCGGKYDPGTQTAIVYCTEADGGGASNCRVNCDSFGDIGGCSCETYGDWCYGIVVWG